MRYTALALIPGFVPTVGRPHDVAYSRFGIRVALYRSRSRQSLDHYYSIERAPPLDTHEPQAKIEGAIEQAKGRWTGCDWYLPIGPNGSDMAGLRAHQAHLLAEVTPGEESKAWEAASNQLRQI